MYCTYMTKLCKMLMFMFVICIINEEFFHIMQNLQKKKIDK